MIKENFFEKNIIFNAKPDAVPYHYRLSYRVALTCLILKKTTGRKACSLAKIHLITTSMYSNRAMKELLNYVDDINRNYILLRFDPTVNKTIDFMLADNFIYQQQNGLFRLSNQGKKFANKLMKQEEFFKDEIIFLEKLSIRLSEDLIENLMNKLMG